MHASDYRSALVSAIAADMLISENHRSLRRSAIECICLYQLGNRSAAISIADRDETDIVKSPQTSAYLKKRFVNTVEVLRFMPQLMSMLSTRRRGN